MMARTLIARLGGTGLVFLVLAAGWGPSTWAQSKHKTYFVGNDGIPVLTNRPHAYRNRPEFDEVTINFEPVVTSGRYSFTPGRAQMDQGDFLGLVKYWSGVYNLDPNMILAVIRAESNFNPNAVSKAGARGLMQLMPGTAAEMRVSNSFDPEQNIAAGTQYLAKLMELFDNNIELALAGYNAGPGAVKKHGGVPPYKETREYVKKVQQFAREYGRGKYQIQLARADAAPPEEFLPEDGGRFTIHYKSGATQPADTVKEEDLFYVVEYSGRKYLVRKKFVERIAKS